MKNKLMIKKLIIVGFIIFFAFSYIRQRIEINRIEKKLLISNLNYKTLKRKMKDFKMKLKKLIQIHWII